MAEDKGSTLKRQMFGYFQTLGFYEYRRGWQKGDCPWCGAEDKMGIHLEDNKTHCFKCDERVKPMKMIMQMEGMRAWKELFSFLEQYDTADYRPVKVEIHEESPVHLPDGFKLLKYGDNRIGKMARTYMRQRGFNIKDLSRKGVGYVGRGSADYFGYIIFPYYKDRKIVFYQTRHFFGTGPKFKNPKVEDFGVGKSQFIYNIAALDRYKEIYLCESVMNALTIGDQGIAINGKAISRVQFSMILRSKCEVVNILLDPDAWKEALDLACSLVPHKWVRVIQFPEDSDVNDLGKEKAMELIKDQPTLYNDITKILRLKWQSI